MKVPPKRKGNVVFEGGAKLLVVGLNESPSEKEGKLRPSERTRRFSARLNESPSEKEGKSHIFTRYFLVYLLPQ